MQAIVSYPSKNQKFIVSDTWEVWNRFSIRNVSMKPKPLNTKGLNTLRSTIFPGQNPEYKKNFRTIRSSTVSENQPRIQKFYQKTGFYSRYFSFSETMGLNVKRLSTPKEISLSPLKTAKNSLLTQMPEQRNPFSGIKSNKKLTLRKFSA